VGCGTGTLALMLNRRVGSAEVHGIDASPEMIEVATTKAHRARTDIDFRICAHRSVAVPHWHPRPVTTTLMLHHLSDDLKRAGLVEIRRVLKPRQPIGGARFRLGQPFSVGTASPVRPPDEDCSVAQHRESTVAKLRPLLEEAASGRLGRHPLPGVHLHPRALTQATRGARSPAERPLAKAHPD
jgi:SAM-dependent methyltransferase